MRVLLYLIPKHSFELWFTLLVITDVVLRVDGNHRPNIGIAHFQLYQFKFEWSQFESLSIVRF